MAGKKSILPDKSLFKRQVEILGYCLSDDAVTSQDLQLLFSQEEATISRDAKTIRSFGIELHSVRKALKVVSPIDQGLLREFITQYIGYCYSSASYDRATALLVKQLKEKALYYIVVLEYGLENNRLVTISYEKERGEIEKDKTIGPMMLFQADGEWRVLALHDGIVKQYILAKIRKIVPTRASFKKVPKEQLIKLFSSMWQGWLGDEKYHIRLLLDHTWASRLNHRVFTENQRLIRNDDGTAILEAGVPNLDEVAGWVVARGTGVTVLEPPELRELVISLARDTLRNYDVPS
jgi:predicted DNA-binding transcriptional regulator YafY